MRKRFPRSSVTWLLQIVFGTMSSWFWIILSSARKTPRGQTQRKSSGVVRSIPTLLGYWALAGVMNDMAEPSQALVAVEKAMRLDPGNRDKYLLSEGFAYLGLGRYEDSITAYKDFLALHPDIFWAHLGLAVDYMELGRDDAARPEA